MLFRSQARAVLAERSRALAATIGKTIASIRLSDPRSRWGSCSSEGGLAYSWRLILAPPFVLDYVVAHEVAHQWWGSVVTPASPKDDWLMESLANYSALLYLEKKRGTKEMEKVLNEYRDELLSKDANGTAFEVAGPIVWGDRLAPTALTPAWRIITYNKGTWILHMLRKRMGDAAFLKLIGELRRRYELKPVTTEDLRALVREFRPQNFSSDAVDMFFDNWV